MWGLPNEFLLYKIKIVLIISIVVIINIGCIAQPSGEERFKDIWVEYLQGSLSDDYIHTHFEIIQVYVPDGGDSVTVFYTIKFNDTLAHTRTATKREGILISGLTRITNGVVEDYHGPLKEYELKISEFEAKSIMENNNCTGLGEPLVLTIGDYLYKGGKYPEDSGLDGFYWLGGTPTGGRFGDKCTVDAENGNFRIKPAPPF